MSINLTLLGQAITFGIFVWFTMKFVWPMIIQAMEEREQKIADGLAAAERGHYELERAHTQAEDELSSARNQAMDIIDKANKRADSIVEKAEGLAREKYEQIIAQAQDDIAQKHAKLKEELRVEVANIAVLGAEKILGKVIDGKAQNDLVTDVIKQLSEG